MNPPGRTCLGHKDIASWYFLFKKISASFYSYPAQWGHGVMECVFFSLVLPPLTAGGMLEDVGSRDKWELGSWV